MKTELKYFITAIVLVVVAAIAIGVYKMTTGNYFINASFITSALVVLALLVLVYAVIVILRKVWMLALLLLSIPLMEGCSYAKANQQVVISTDCGMTWQKINIGEAVPKGVGNRCFMKVVMPNFPLQGDSRFVSNFKDRVRAAVHIDYDYSIIEPLAFIKQAKYLGKANTDADSEGALDASAFEGAENMVIDKRIRDVSKSLLLQEDIVELDQSELESHLFTESNKVLEPLGIHLNFITLTFDLDEQTRQAIDVATAMKIYQTKELTELGKAVISARAGATKVSVETKLPQAASEDSK